MKLSVPISCHRAVKDCPMFEFNWLSLLPAALLALLLTELTDWFPRIGEKIIIHVSKYHPKLPKERKNEYLANFDEIPGKFSKLLYAITCAWGVFQVQENRHIIFIKFFAASSLILGRIAVLYMVVGIAYAMVQDVISGAYIVLPFGTLFISIFSLTIHKLTDVDFSWYPDFKHTKKFNKLIFGLFVFGLIGSLIIGSPLVKILVILMVSSLVVFILREVYVSKRS